MGMKTLGGSNGTLCLQEVLFRARRAKFEALRKHPVAQDATTLVLRHPFLNYLFPQRYDAGLHQCDEALKACA